MLLWFLIFLVNPMKILMNKRLFVRRDRRRVDGVFSVSILWQEEADVWVRPSCYTRKRMFVPNVSVIEEQKCDEVEHRTFFTVVLHFEG